MSSHHIRALTASAFLLVIILNAGCSGTPNRPTSTPTSSPKFTSTAQPGPSLTPTSPQNPSPTLVNTGTPTASASPTSLFTQTITPTSNTTGTPGIASIPAILSLTGGNYLLYLTHRPSSAENKQSIISFSPSSKLNVDLKDDLPLTLSATSRLSGDKTRLAYIDNKTLVILDLNKQTTTQITLDHDCYGLSWSPKGDQLLLACGDIYLFTLTGHTWQPLTTSTKAKEWSAPAWSPDGKWIAYIHPAETMPPVKPTATPTVSYKTKTPQPTQEPIQVKNPLDGLYLVNATCLINIQSCKSFTFFVQAWLYAPSAPSWSPDSIFVAVYDTGTITIYNSVGKYQREIDLQELHTRADWAFQPIVWSPDNEWLALSGAQGDAKSMLSLVSIHALTVYNMITGDQPITLVDWFALPTLKKGGSYIVSMAGDTWRLHETPSADATITRRLKHNDTFTVIDGPVYAEGYIWWKIREKIEKTEGWAVENPDWFINSK